MNRIFCRKDNRFKYYILKNVENLCFIRYLTLHHQYLQYCDKYIEMKLEWKNIVFSDKQKI